MLPASKAALVVEGRIQLSILDLTGSYLKVRESISSLKGESRESRSEQALLHGLSPSCCFTYAKQARFRK